MVTSIFSSSHIWSYLLFLPAAKLSSTCNSIADNKTVLLTTQQCRRQHNCTADNTTVQYHGQYYSTAEHKIVNFILVLQRYHMTGNRGVSRWVNQLTFKHDRVRMPPNTWGLYQDDRKIKNIIDNRYRGGERDLVQGTPSGGPNSVDKR